MSDLLDLALKAHGGLDRWREVKSLDVRVSLTGALYHLKGYPEGVPNVTVRIDTRRPAVTISAEIRALPSPVMCGRPRGINSIAFISPVTRSGTTSTPFLLTRPGFELTEIEPHQENGETWRCLRVKFPSDVPTHNNFQVGGEQTFFFNEQGLLQRLDYLAVGPAAHYCFYHTNYKGIVFPTLRRVLRRLPSGPLVNGPTAVLVQIADVLLGEGDCG